MIEKICKNCIYWKLREDIVDVGDYGYCYFIADFHEHRHATSTCEEFARRER